MSKERPFSLLPLLQRKLWADAYYRFQYRKEQVFGTKLLVQSDNKVVALVMDMLQNF